MGSLTSGPKISAPSPTYVSAPSPSTPAANTNDAADEPSAEERASAARQKSLLGRERGRFGTVNTSFRGLLDAVTSAGNKKKLLGE